jgi:uncharacterized membrane protein YfcA
MSFSDFWLNIVFGFSLLSNLILGMYVIGIFIKKPEKKAKNPKLVLYMIGITVGFLGGMLGNITITSMFELAKLNQQISPEYWGSIFLLSTVGTVVILIKMYSLLKEGIGE